MTGYRFFFYFYNIVFFFLDWQHCFMSEKISYKQMKFNKKIKDCVPNQYTHFDMLIYQMERTMILLHFLSFLSLCINCSIFTKLSPILCPNYKHILVCCHIWNAP